MDILLNDNIYYKPFKTETELKKFIVRMIYDAKSDKILYKGNPTEIEYRLLKKLILSKESKKNKESVSPADIKYKYSIIVESQLVDPLCIIYKK